MTDSTADSSSRSETAPRIVEAATRLFAERGYEGVSIRDIAAAAGVSKANVFHHFANKWELYKSVIDASSEQSRDLLNRLKTSGGSVEELLAVFGCEHLSQMLHQEHATRLCFRQLLDTQPSDDRELAQNAVEQNFCTAVTVIADLKAEGKLPAHVEPTALALTIVGSHLAYFLLQDLLGRRPETSATAAPEDYHRALSQLLLQGLGPTDSDQRK